MAFQKPSVNKRFNYLMRCELSHQALADLQQIGD